MITEAVQAAPAIDITAVTILTSLSEDDLFDIGYAHSALESAVSLARLAVDAGAKEIVSSPLEISAIRNAIGDKASIITPGVRPAGTQGNDDQNRTMTPSQAIREGADYVVIGRPITSFWKDGAQAMTIAARAIADEILQQ
jgi:orotidine-5'-phosphate decarboxylase